MIVHLAIVLAFFATAPLTVAGPPGDGLLRAIRNNDSNILASAIDASPNLARLTAADGKTVLMAAAADGNVALIESLLKRGVAVDATNNRGGTALMYAAANGEGAAATLLIDAGAAVDERAENGWTPLTLASAKGHVAMVELLLDSGADPNIPDVFGFTPLMRAIANQRTATATFLLGVPRVDTRWTNIAGEDALSLAAASGSCDLSRLVEEALAARSGSAPDRANGATRTAGCAED